LSASSVSAACFIVAQSDWLPMMIATGFDDIVLPIAHDPERAVPDLDTGDGYRFSGKIMRREKIRPGGRKRRIIG
jgi:hypothetical protein